MNRAIYFIFFLSGVSALAYEVLWTRMFGVIFGNTVQSASLVLAAFMGGLSLGSWRGGGFRIHPRKALLVYGFLEGGIALFALFFPLMLRSADTVYALIYHHFASAALLNGMRFLLSFCLLLIPTTLMGATFPVLCVYCARGQEPIGRPVGRLYAFNTLGSVAGCFSVGFYLMHRFGLTHTLYLAAGLNGCALFLSVLLFFSADQDGSSAPSERDPRPLSRGAIREILPLLIFYGLCGFTSLAYEVVWTRILVFALGTKAYAFSMMLFIFLGGIALGSFLVSQVAGHVRRPGILFSWIETALGFNMILNLFILYRFPQYHQALVEFFGMQTWPSILAFKGLIPMIFLLPPTVLMGAAFPVITLLCCGSGGNAGREVGRVYAVNTFGAILGSLAAGFLLIPGMGVQKTLMILALVNFCIGMLVMLGERKQGRGGSPALIPALGILFFFLLATLPPRAVESFYNVRTQFGRLLYAKEGISGSVTVHQYADYRVISVDGVNVAGTLYPLRTTQKLQGHLPALLHPLPRTVLQIGFGSGETCRVLTLYPFDRIRLAEINPEVIEVSNRFFRKINRGATMDTRFRAIIMDGKNYLKLTDKKYDLILNDSTYPGLAGSSSLYTLDHFQNGAARLNRGGLFSSWLPIDIQPEQFNIVLRTFATAFPYASLWLANNCDNKHALLVGSRDPIHVDLSSLLRKISAPPVRRDLEEVHLADPLFLLGSYLLDREGMFRVAGKGPVNTDDHPVLEFSDFKKLVTAGESWPENLSRILRYRTSFVRLLRNGPDPSFSLFTTQARSLFQANTYFLEGLLFDLTEDMRAGERFKAALKSYPAHPGVRYMFANLEDKILAAQKASDPSGSLMQEGLAYSRYGLLDHAETAFRKALLLSPDSWEIRNNLGNTYYRRGEWGKAEQEYEAVLRTHPRGFESLVNLGNIRFKQGNYDAAIGSYLRALKLNPESAVAHRNLGSAYQALGKGPEAMEHFQKAAELDSDRSASPTD